MKSPYYLSLKPLTAGHYYLHGDKCPFLPLHGKRIYLGRFRSPGDAIAAAMKYNIEFDYCKFCLSEPIKSGDPIPPNDGYVVEKGFIPAREIREEWDSMLTYCRN